MPNSCVSMKRPARKYLRELRGRVDASDSEQSGPDDDRPRRPLPIAAGALWSRYAGPPLQRPPVRRRRTQYLFLEEPSVSHQDVDPAAYNPMLPLALRHRARERVVHYLDYRPRFLVLGERLRGRCRSVSKIDD